MSPYRILCVGYGTLADLNAAVSKFNSYLHTMPVRKNIPYTEGLFYITFTCYNWLSLIQQTNGYDLVYGWFDYLKKQNHRIAGYVIMPNHVHAMIDFVRSAKRINTVIGDGKRFMAYEVINRLEKTGNTSLLAKLEQAVVSKSKEKGKQHEVWEESFVPIGIGRKICETAAFAYQKLIYMHNNPCAGRWKLADDITKYDHSSARYYISGRHVAYEVTNVEDIINSKMLQSPESSSHKAGL